MLGLPPNEARGDIHSSTDVHRAPLPPAGRTPAPCPPQYQYPCVPTNRTPPRFARSASAWRTSACRRRSKLLTSRRHQHLESFSAERRRLEADRHHVIALLPADTPTQWGPVPRGCDSICPVLRKHLYIEGIAKTRGRNRKCVEDASRISSKSSKSLQQLYGKASVSH